MDANPTPPPPYVYGCYRHPDRPTGLGCQRCGRPICPECVRPAAVGFQCPECAAEQVPVTYPARTPQRRSAAAPVTTALIGLNVAVWAAILLTGQYQSWLVNLLALQPEGVCTVRGLDYVRVSPQECLQAGGTYFAGVSEGSVWQLLTSAFTHVSLVHIAFNMVALWFLGPQLERFLGWRRYLALYLLSALAGSVAVFWLADPTSSTLGASGAVFGLMGALLIVAWRLGNDVTQLLVWLGANVAITFAAGEGISWQGHLGGLAGGLVVAALLLRRTPDDRSRPRGPLIALTVVLVGLTVVRAWMLG
nr:rhomboid family intramembrane serine protease [Propionibacterium sp.]